MAYDHFLADRIRTELNKTGVRFKEKEMFGGIAFMVRDKMCVGIIKNDLMARIDPDIYERLLKKKGVKPMMFTGKPMRGYVYVSPGAVDSSKELSYWISLCLEFNPKASSNKKRVRRNTV